MKVRITLDVEFNEPKDVEHIDWIEQLQDNIKEKDIDSILETISFANDVDIVSHELLQ